VSEPDATASGVDASTTTDDPEAVGSVAQEAFKLFRAVTAASADPDGPHHEHGAGHDHLADHDHECTTAWCPVCRVVGLVRDNPDAIASVKRSATDLARSLRDLVDVALAPEEKKQ